MALWPRHQQVWHTRQAGGMSVLWTGMRHIALQTERDRSPQNCSDMEVWETRQLLHCMLMKSLHAQPPLH